MSTEQTHPEIEWTVSSSPHIRARASTGRIMWSVVAALMPAAAWSVYVFGVNALHVIGLSVATCIVTEYACTRLRGQAPTLADGSAVVTGLLLAFVLPSHAVIANDAGPVTVLRLGLLNWYVPVVGAVFAIAVVKHCFGGLGHNIWNPALAGRAFVQLSFSGLMNPPAWPWPRGETINAMTSATSLSKTSAAAFPLKALFLGECPGCLGEVSACLLLLGAVYLICKKYVNWRLPLAYIVALVVFATLFAWSPRASGVPVWTNRFAMVFEAFRAGGFAADHFADSWGVFACRVLFSGGVMLGALYMATDMVTSPLSSRGQVYYGIGCGLLTALIRSFSGMPEGVCYAILLMNTVRPYIDRISRRRVLGETKATS